MGINPNHDGNLGFQSLLYYAFIIRKKYRVDVVAKEMQIATDTLYRYVRGENIMPPDRIIDLVKATGDPEFLEFFSEPCGFATVPIQKAKATGHEVEGDLFHLPVLVGDLFHEWEAARPDGIDKEEGKRLEKVISKAISKLAGIREKIRAEVGI